MHPDTIKANLWSRGTMVPMPRTLMGVPTDARALAESGVISRAGLARAALDAVLPATRLGEQDVSVGWLIEERFGKEVVDRLVEPLLGGVYAGHAREISARAAVPQVVALLDRDKSMLKAAAQATAATSDVPVFAGLVGGLGQLPAAVAASRASTSAPTPPCATWPGAAAAAGTSWWAPRTTRRWCRPTPSSWPHPPAPPPGCSATWCPTRPWSWRGSSTRRWP